MKESAADRLRWALDMYEFGEQLYRQRLKRENPRASETWVEQQIQNWLFTRPGAEFGDSVGRLSDRFNEQG